MSPSDRWHQIDTIFDQALDCAPAERSAFLEDACAGDDALRRAVEDLLEAARAESPLDEPLKKRSGPFWSAFARALSQSSPKASRARQAIGPYQIVRDIGCGGMGAVYLAERRDDQFTRQVAIKVLRRDIGREAVRRFLAERQILASLSHPNIARLYDGGVTEDGQPYFVMEYVEGTPIDVYCNKHSLSIRERLHLFLPVLEAVQAAHRRLIVHRDLKPANILVTSEGSDGKSSVKLLDFGIAKLLDPATAGLDASPPETRTGLYPMTPAYASPEQVRGEAITTATDVYALGLVLYELLTGQRPYRVEGRTPSEIEQIICEKTPERPSTVVTDAEASHASDDSAKYDSSATPADVSDQRRTQPARLQQILRGDLDAIVLMALRKDPERRYESTEQFADDIGRYLEGRPVKARPDTLSYRAKKFMRRHRTGVVAAMLVVLSLCGGLIGTIWQARRATEQAAEAARERDKAEQVTTFLMNLFEANDPGEALGDTITARQLLARGVDRAEALSTQPDVQAQMFDVVGQVYQRLGRYEKAQPLLERALSLRRDLHSETHTGVATSMVHLAMVLRKKGDYDAAESLLRDALEVRKRLLTPGHPDVARALSILGGIQMDRGAYDEAESMLREALAMQRDAHGSVDLDVAQTSNILGLLLEDQGDYDAAEPFLRRALEIRRTLLSNQDPRVAMSLNNLALVLRKKGDLEAAEPIYREALAVKKAIYGEEHPSIAATLTGLGLLLHDQEHYGRAEPFLREALTMRRDLLGPNHPSMAASLTNMGNLLEAQGHLNEAKKHMREARAVLQAAVGDTHPFVAFPTIGLARILMKEERPEDAEPLIREALAIRKRTLPAGHWQIGEIQGFLGSCLTKQERYPEAESLLVQGYETIRAEQGTNHPSTQHTLKYLTALFDAWGKPERAALYRGKLKPSVTEP